MGQGSPSNLFEKLAPRSKLLKDATWTKTATQTFYKNEYERLELYPLCQFLYDYEAGKEVFNSIHRNGADFFYLNVLNKDNDDIIAYQDRDDNLIYGYTDANGTYHGDYKANVKGYGLTEVIEFYPAHSMIPEKSTIKVVNQGQSNIPVYHSPIDDKDKDDGGYVDGQNGGQGDGNTDNNNGSGNNNNTDGTDNGNNGGSTDNNSTDNNNNNNNGGTDGNGGSGQTDNGNGDQNGTDTNNNKTYILKCEDNGERLVITSSQQLADSSYDESRKCLKSVFNQRRQDVVNSLNKAFDKCSRNLFSGVHCVQISVDDPNVVIGDYSPVLYDGCAINMPKKTLQQQRVESSVKIAF